MAMNKVIGIIAIFFAALGRAAAAGAQAKPLSGGDVERIYTRLREQIARIPIYDNHSHATFPDDADMDAMAAPPGESSVLRLRDDNPEFVAAAKALFAYPYNDFQPEHAKWLIDKKKAAEASGNTAYWDGILDKMNIATCLANRVAFAPYLDPQRFHWVFFADSFLFPFDNRDQAAKNGDMAVYVPLQEKVLKRYMKQEGLGGLPLDLAGYENFVRQTLADNQKKGGVAMKFEAAYFRSLYFGDPPRASAEAIYAKFHAGGLPSEQEYRTFQDYVFREMIWMTAAKNVYTDSSLMGYYVYPSELKNILKQWISLFPEKIMFGSDAFPFNDAVGAEETFWLAAESARTALAAALAELVAEGAFGEAKALELARMYLHDNAAKLYGDQK